MIMTLHSVNNNTCMGLVISLCSNSNHLVSLSPTKAPSPPQTATNFRHLLSCSTIETVTRVYLTCTKFFIKCINLHLMLKPFSSISEEPFNYVCSKFYSNFIC